MIENTETTKDLLTPTGLRLTLAETLGKLSNGDISVNAANAIANTAGKIFSSYKLQIDYHKHINKQAHLPELETKQ